MCARRARAGITCVSICANVLLMPLVGGRVATYCVIKLAHIGPILGFGVCSG